VNSNVQQQQLPGPHKTAKVDKSQAAGAMETPGPSKPLAGVCLFLHGWAGCGTEWPLQVCTLHFSISCEPWPTSTSTCAQGVNCCKLTSL